MKSRYEGVVLNGIWKFDHMERGNKYTFKNIYNGTEVEITVRQIKDVESGKTTISKIICKRINRNNDRIKAISNYTVENYNNQKRKYANIKK